MKIFRTVGPYLTAAGVLAMVVVLISAIYFTLFDLQWIAFLAGIMVAAILAMVSRASHAEWTIARRTAQLQRARENLAQEGHRRQQADAALATAKARLQFLDTNLPVMAVYLDAEARCRYHNAAFGTWLGLKPDKIEGWRLAEILGEKVYGEISGDIKDALAGRLVRRDRMQKMANGAIYQLSVQYLAHHGIDGKIAGVYALYTDITGQANVQNPQQADTRSTAPNVQELFDSSFSEQVTGWDNAADRIATAIEKDEFRLFSQLIAPLDGAAGLANCYEVLIRLIEEEQNLMAPGAFLPLAEKYGLMPKLDRWVVRQVLKWASARSLSGARTGMLCINVSGATIDDPAFPEFVAEQRRIFDVPGEALCFELDEPDAITRREDGARFVAQLRKQGCHATLSGFGRDRALFDLPKGLGVDLLKIDGNLILGMLREPVSLAKVTAINKVAHASGLRTIAEYVENDDTAAKLRALGVDYAQGFGISLPRPLDEITSL
jgi:PAS domain S-box-containing protein